MTADTYMWRRFTNSPEFINDNYLPLFEFLYKHYKREEFKTYESIDNYYHYLLHHNPLILKNRPLNYIKNMSGTYGRLSNFGYLDYRGTFGRAKRYRLGTHALDLLARNYKLGY